MHDADVEGTAFQQGLGVRYSSGDFVPGTGFYWHTGSGYGLFAQYLQSAEADVNRGIVVVATGSTVEREANGMVSICTDMSAAVWAVFEELIRGEEEEDDDDEEIDD
jgi:hypothetical protein